MDNDMGAPEKKTDLAAVFGEFMGAFEAFRETNDRRLAELETKGADVVTVEKLTRVEAALDANQRRMDEMVLKSARPSLMGAAPVAHSERKSAFDFYVRSGNEAGLRAFEQKALTGGSADAGVTVPADVEAEVMRRLALISPLRSIAGVRQVSGSVFKKPVATGAAANTASWVGEVAARPETTSPALKPLEFPTMELYAMPAASSTLLDDTAVDMDQWLAEEIETVFAEQETKAFVVGDGTVQPKGFTTYATGTSANWSSEQLEAVKTGVNGAFPASAPYDKLIDLVYSLKASYRQNAHFVMSRSTQATIRKMKDAEGQYLWTPPAMPGGRAGLLNFPVVEAEDMPAMTDATNRNAIAFGDFRRGYLIVDRQGLRILRDPYSAKPYVLFYTTKRVGGGVQDFDAIKFLQFAA